MAAVEISIQVTSDGDVVIPRTYTKGIPAGSAVRVLIRWEELAEPEQQNPNADEEALNSFVTRIKGHTLLSAYTPSAGKILAEDWANPIGEVDANFDIVEWNQAWDEAIYDITEHVAEEAVELRLNLRRRGWQLNIIDAFVAVIALHNNQRIV